MEQIEKQLGKQQTPKEEGPKEPTIVQNLVSYKKNIDSVIEDKTQAVQKIFSALEKQPVEMRETLDQQEEFAINEIKQLFQEVIKEGNSFKKKLTAIEVKQELNQGLIERILPELDLLQSKGKITKEDTQEFIELLKTQLDEGIWPNWNDPIEKKEAMKLRKKRLNELDQKSDYYYRLGVIESKTSSRDINPANVNYDRIFDFLIREATKQRVEQLHNRISGSLSPELQVKIAEITETIIRTEKLDLKKMPIEDFEKLKGLERWQVVKDFMVSSGIISKEIFTRVEKIIIQRFFNEVLSPGGSNPNNDWVVEEINKINNPEALPFMLHHIQTFEGSNIFNIIICDEMERLLKKSNPVEIQQVLKSLPRNKKNLLKILADKNSYLNRYPGKHRFLRDGDLVIVKEQLAKILENSGKFNKKELQDFCLSHDIDPKITELLLKIARPEVEKTIIESKLDWTQSANKLLADLVDPSKGDISVFPKKIAKEGLGISDKEMLDKLDEIFKTKTFKKDIFTRKVFLRGLVLLNSKENGKEILETLLGAYRGTKEDIARIRRIFQFFSMLEDFKEYDTEIKSLESEFQNLTDLKGIEKAMKSRVVDVACRRLELSSEYKEKIENKLEELSKSGVLKIISSLLSRYERLKEPEVKNLLKIITTHIIDGDFKKWRYNHEKSKEQLAGLTKEQIEIWKENMKPVTVDIELPKDEKEKRENFLKVVRERIEQAKDHIFLSKPNFKFSKERVEELKNEVNKLTEKIKLGLFEKEKRELAKNREILQAEIALINKILEIENVTSQSFDKEKILAQAKKIGKIINELNIPMAGLDVEQIEKVFKYRVEEMKSITASESDDILALLKIGVIPIENCQSWRGGEYNECLLAYVADSNKKVIDIANDKGEIIARTTIKLTNQRDVDDFESKTQKKTLLVEKPYSLLFNKGVTQAFIHFLLKKAQGLNVSITFSSKDFDEDVLQIFKEEAKSVAYEMKEKTIEAFIPVSLNKYEYNDILGGKISEFNRYQPIEKAISFKNQKYNSTYH